jgi:hypothetical protein
MRVCVIFNELSFVFKKPYNNENKKERKKNKTKQKNEDDIYD